jgi:hypothetical protein
MRLELDCQAQTQPVTSGVMQIKHHDVRARATQERPELSFVACGADEIHVGLAGDDRLDPRADGGMVVEQRGAEHGRALELKPGGARAERARAAGPQCRMCRRLFHLRSAA